jgi:hypothetical protein
MSAITLTVQRYYLDGLPMPIPAAGSIGPAYNIAPSMHDQYSTCLDDDDDDDSLYSSLRPRNINHIHDDDTIDDDNEVSWRDYDVSWNDDSAAYASHFCVTILSFDGMLLWALSLPPKPSYNGDDKRKISRDNNDVEIILLVEDGVPTPPMAMTVNARYARDGMMSPKSIAVMVRNLMVMAVGVAEGGVWGYHSLFEASLYNTGWPRPVGVTNNVTTWGEGFWQDKKMRCVGYGIMLLLLCLTSGLFLERAQYLSFCSPS